MNDSLAEPDPPPAAPDEAPLEFLVSAAPPHAATTNASRGTVSRARDRRFTEPPDRSRIQSGLRSIAKSTSPVQCVAARLRPGAPRNRDPRLVGQHHRLHA